MPPIHISAALPTSNPWLNSSSTVKSPPNPFPLSLGDGEDGSIGLNVAVRTPSQPGIYKPPSLNIDPSTHTAVPNSWTMCALIERHSAAIGTLQGNITIAIDRPNTQAPNEEQLIQQVLAEE